MGRKASGRKEYNTTNEKREQVYGAVEKLPLRIISKHVIGLYYYVTVERIDLENNRI